jgi:hypothetical protein
MDTTIITMMVTVTVIPATAVIIITERGKTILLEIGEALGPHPR